jgi:hypothetical protein
LLKYHTAPPSKHAEEGQLDCILLQSGGTFIERLLVRIGETTLDHQSTLGLYVGKTALQDGHGVMTSYEYLDGAAFQPSDDEVRKKRPADSQ